MRRNTREVLARARILSLVSTVAEGCPAEEVSPDLARFDLEWVLTPGEGAVLRGDAEPEAGADWQVEAMLALAWALGLARELGPRDPEAYGPVQQALMDESAESAIAPRADDEVTAMLKHLEQVAAHGDDPPPRERYGAEVLRWRRAALQWALDDARAWAS